MEQPVGCTTFGGFAERALKVLHKGTMVLVKGEPAVRQFTKKDGTNAAMLEVVVSDFVVLSSPKREAGDEPQQARPARQAQAQTREANARDAFEAEAKAYDAFC